MTWYRNQERTKLYRKFQTWIIQIPDECDHCQEGRGPWARCAVVRGPAGEGLACNNCHQLGRGSRCQKYVPPAGGVPQRTPRQQRVQQALRSDQSSADSQVSTTDTFPFPDAVESLIDDLRDLHRYAQRVEDAYSDGNLRSSHIRDLMRNFERVQIR